MTWSIIFWLLALALLGSSLAYGKYVQRFAQQAATEWSSTVGHVVGQSVRNNGNGTFGPEISYVFNVDGHSYASDRLRPGGTPYFYGMSRVSAILDAFPVGRDVTVHYQPGKPKRCAIECKPMSHGLTIVYLLTAAAFVVAFLVTFQP